MHGQGGGKDGFARLTSYVEMLFSELVNGVQLYFVFAFN